MASLDRPSPAPRRRPGAPRGRPRRVAHPFSRGRGQLSLGTWIRDEQTAAALACSHPPLATNGYATACRRCSTVLLTCAASASCTTSGGRRSWSCPWSSASGVFPARCRWAAPVSPAPGQVVPWHPCSRAFVRLTLLRSLDDDLVCLTVGKSEILRVSEFNTLLGLPAPFAESRPSEAILASRALDSLRAMQNLRNATVATGERERIL